MDFAFRPGEIESSPPESFLYQAGYLTIRKGAGSDFNLDYPNAEVLNSMSELVYKNMTQRDGNFLDLRSPLVRALENGNSELFIETLNRLLSSILYDDYNNAAKQAIAQTGIKITTQEWLYRSTILAFLHGCNVLAFGEMHGNKGRSDLIVSYAGTTYIIEFKVARNDDCDALAAEALKQISDKQYAGPYANAKKIGIAIDDKARQVGAWVEG
jgi:hypothetical protein